MISKEPVRGSDSLGSLTSHVENSLRSSGYASLRMLKVMRTQDRIHIKGEVPSYYMKQVASVLASAVAMDVVVHNDLIVV